MNKKARIEKVVSQLPATLSKNTIYYVRVGNGFEIYCTNDSGVIVAYPTNYLKYSQIENFIFGINASGTIEGYSPDLGLPNNSFKPSKSGFYRPNYENDYGGLLMWVNHSYYINDGTYGAGIAFDYGGNNAWLTGTDSTGNKTPNRKIWTSGDFNPSDFATSAQLGNKVDKAGDTMTGNLNALTISAQNASDKLIYDNIENYGSPLQINANASLGIFLQANANNILYVGASYVETYKDLYVSAGSIIYTTNHGNSSLWYQAYNWGNHANAGYATQTWVNNNTIQTPNGRPINISGEDLNTWRKTGFYVGEGLQNAPNNGWFYILVQTYDNNVWIKQTATSFGSGNAPNITYERVMQAGNWGDWEQVYKSSDFSIQNYYTKNEALNLFVGKNGVENIYDTKTFNSSPIIPNATLGTHAVNLNQLNSRAGAWENATAIGFSNGNADDAPYIYHNTAGYRFLATQTWVDNEYLERLDSTVKGLGFDSGNTDYPYIFSSTGVVKHLAVQNNTVNTPNGRPINISGQNLNNYRQTGFYVGEGMANAPDSGWFHILIQTYDNNAWIKQTVTSFGSGNGANKTAERVMQAGTWTNWKYLLSTDEISFGNVTLLLQLITNAVTINDDQIIDSLKTFTKPITINSTLDVSGQTSLNVVDCEILNTNAGIVHYGYNDPAYVFTTDGGVAILASGVPKIGVVQPGDTFQVDNSQAQNLEVIFLNYGKLFLPIPPPNDRLRGCKVVAKCLGQQVQVYVETNLVYTMNTNKTLEFICIGSNWVMTTENGNNILL